VGLCAAAFPGLAVVLRSGQLTGIVWLLIGVASAAKRPAVGGAVLGIVAFKPHLLVPPAAILTIWRCTRWMFWLLLSIGVQAALAVCIAGTGPVLAYIEALLVLAVRPELIEPFAETDHSIRSLVSAHTAPGGLVVLQALALGMGVGAALFVWFRSTDWRLRWSAAVCAMLVASPHLMTYDLMLVGIPILLMCDWGLDHPRGIDWRALIGLLGLAYMMPIASPPVATATGVQLSVPVMWLLLTLCVVAAKSRETAAVERA
jgi:hypothetical protein